ncbi:hypothetical protein KI688_002942 [Linnemannia hyalina]|uniref:Uncharacterized protein n=1 Tax=Linnemannia hyalina TaxID=64524 RepID=A0A9P7XPI7_9FUNG|nr:hypothetical protein KI688_002942 [Linnemannia hyalina]
MEYLGSYKFDQISQLNPFQPEMVASFFVSNPKEMALYHYYRFKVDQESGLSSGNDKDYGIDDNGSDTMGTPNDEEDTPGTHALVSIESVEVTQPYTAGTRGIVNTDFAFSQTLTYLCARGLFDTDPILPGTWIGYLWTLTF